MSKALITESLLTGIADAIRAKTGETGTMTPAQMATKIAGITGGGDDETLKKILDRTIEQFSSDDAVTIGKYAFYSCGSLTSVTAQACESVEAHAFDSCALLSSVDLPKCTYVGQYAFNGCGKISSVNLPLCEGLAAYAFTACSSLASISLPQCAMVVKNTFWSCTGLKEIHFAAANQATIEALNGYSTKFGATSATIYFDL